MSGSLVDWLALREPADAAARSLSIIDEVARRLPPAPLRIVDLGTGTGANVRFLSPRLPVSQSWRAVDNDPSVLAELSRRMSEFTTARPGCQIEPVRADLGRVDAQLLGGCDLVTASALLDLVSAAWIESLAERCLNSRAAVLFALTYNGRSRCDPAEPEDDLVRNLMNRHQRSNDKGFGVAAGPDATDCAERSFTAAGYRTLRASSDWTLPPWMQELQRRLIHGWADAASEVAPERAATIRDWLGRKLQHVDAGRSRVSVGHDDFAAWLE